MNTSNVALIGQYRLSGLRRALGVVMPGLPLPDETDANLDPASARVAEVRITASFAPERRASE